MRPVEISIQSEDGDIFRYSGSCTMKKEKSFVSYDDEGDQMILRIEKKCLAVLRPDDRGGHIIYDPDRPYRMTCPTPAGDMCFLLQTESYHQRVLNDEMDIQIRYTLRVIAMDGQISDEPDIVRTLLIRIESV